MINDLQILHSNFLLSFQVRKEVFKYEAFTENLKNREKSGKVNFSFLKAILRLINDYPFERGCR